MQTKTFTLRAPTDEDAGALAALQSIDDERSQDSWVTTAHDILHEWRTLKPAEVFDALSYYHDHKAEIDAEIEEMNDIEAAMRRYPPTLLPQDDGRRSNLL